MTSRACLDLQEYPDGSASLILAASESQKRPPSFFTSPLAHSILTKPLDKQAVIDELNSQYMIEDLNSLLSDVSLCGESRNTAHSMLAQFSS